MGGKFATRHAHAIIRRNPDLAPLRKDHQALDKRVGSSSIKPPRRTRARQRNAMPAAYLDWLATHLDEVDATLFFDEMQEILIFQFGCCYHRSTICSAQVEQDRSARKRLCALCGGRTWRELIRLDLSFSMRRDGSWNAHSRLSRVHPRHARLQRPRSAHDGRHCWGFNHQGPGG